MKRDAWYAAIAAFALLGVAALYALIRAPSLADPEVSLSQARLTASRPLPPRSTGQDETLDTALTILDARNPFVPRPAGEEVDIRGLSLPKLGPPVRFSEPGTASSVEVASEPARPALQPRESVPAAPRASSPPPPAQAAPARQQPAPRAQGTLTLRGVYPSPSGGRAHVALPDGRIVVVGVGGLVGGWQVRQIRQGAIRLGRGQREIILAMPR